MSRIPELRGRPLLATALVLFIAGFLNDPPWKHYSPQQHVDFITEPSHIARNLLTEGTYANPFGVLPTGPTAHSAPAFPILTFLVLKCFGDQSVGWLAIRSLVTLALSLQFALLPYVARLFGYSAWTGVLASLLGLLIKPGREELWESHLAGLMILILTATSAYWMKSGRTPAMAAAIGAIAGIAILLLPVIALVYVAWTIWVARSSGIFTKQTLPLWIVPCVLCAPWIIRTSVTLHGPVYIRDDLGTEIRVSFNDCAPYGVRESERVFCFQSVHPNVSREQATAVRDLGEYRYNQSSLGIGVEWIAHHPKRTAQLIAERFWFFWFPADHSWTSYLEQRKRFLILHLATLLSFVGLFQTWKLRRQSAMLLTLWLAIFPLIYYVVQFEERYRYPILWITLLEAACVLEGFWRKPATSPSFPS